MLDNHRRAFLWSFVLLASMVLVFVAVGRHDPGVAPVTTIVSVGEWDLTVYKAMDDIQSQPLTFLARILNVLGGGLVTIPLRIAVAGWLAFRARWRALSTWMLTWAFAEVLLRVGKAYFHRGRPPDALVETFSFSFPSGHAVAASATAVALVLVLLQPAPERRRWEAAAVGFAFVMAFSRVYLRAHWLSDVVAGVLLGAGIALGAAALTTEVRDIALRRRERATTGPGPAPANPSGPATRGT